ncbi:glycosyltransferase family 39 protein, partial [bacterium]|nr:glycosyltransferase family 39 protein [bacterium]
ALLLCNFILLGTHKTNTIRNPDVSDTSAYLGEANSIKVNGGISKFINLCINGNYKQANQHPLYILLISTFASRDISFFVNAKILSLIIGLILLLCTFFVANKMFGQLVASVSVFALILNSQFLLWTSRVACESLLMIFTLFCMYFVIKGFDDNKYWFYAGAFAGLAYLTKITGLFLIPAFGLSTLIVYRLKVFSNKYFWSFFIIFLIVASPLIIRNVKVYRNPFFNSNMAIFLYEKGQMHDSLYKSSSPDDGADLWKFDAKVREGFESKKPLSNTIKLSVLFGRFKKLKSGIQTSAQEFLICSNIFPKSNISNKIVKLIFYILSFFLFIVGILKENSFGARVYVIITILTFVILLSFNPHYRYYLPLIPLMIIYMTLGIFTLLDWANKAFFMKHSKLKVFHYIRPVLILSLIAMGAYIFATKGIPNPAKSVDYSDSRRLLVKWLSENLKETDKYTLGPGVHWQLEMGTHIVPPKGIREDMEKFTSFVNRNKICYVIIDSFSLTAGRYRGGIDRRKMVEGYFDLDPTEGIVEKKEPDGWNLVYKDQAKPVELLVYKVVN